MEKLFKILGNGLIIIVILACLPIALPKLVGFQEYNVISGSMEPEITVNSICYVKETLFEDLAVGDIIAFESGASTITHRIVDIDRDSKLITTKGDANSANDFMPVAYTNVLGVVKFHLPLLGKLASALSETTGKIVAALILIAGILISSLVEKDSKASTDDTTRIDISKPGVNPKIVLMLGLLIIFGSCGGFLYIYMDYQGSNTIYNSLNEQYVSTNVSGDGTEANWYDLCDVDLTSIEAINKDVVGWLYVENTDISYPIMFSGDDDAYLRTTITGKAATAGSIFLEGENLPDFSDCHNIIYGHNMRNLSMFGSLKFYKTEADYLDGHEYFQIITQAGKSRYQIFSYFDTEPGSWVYSLPFYPGDEYQNYINNLISNSYVDIDKADEVDSNDYIVTLSTCSNEGMRFTIHGVLVDKK